TCWDQEGAELPNRAAARAEALAVIRDLSRSQAERNRWTGWLLRVEDDAGQFFCSPIGHPGLALVSNDEPSKRAPPARRPLEDVVAETARRASELRALLERNQRLREELQAEILLGTQAKLRANELLARSSSPR